MNSEDSDLHISLAKYSKLSFMYKKTRVKLIAQKHLALFEQRFP